MKKFLSILMRVQTHIAGIAFLIIFCINTMEIISRSFFNHSFLWVSDISTICIVWMICMGMAIGVYKGDHIFLELLISKLPLKTRHLVSVVTQLLTLAFFILLFVTGIEMTLSKQGLIFPTLMWSMVWAYAALPVFALSAALYMIPSTIEILTGRETYKEAQGGDLRWL